MWGISKNRSWYWFDCKCFSRVDTKHRIIFVFSSFTLCSIIYLFKKGRGLIPTYPQRIVKIIHYLYWKDVFSYGHSVQYKILLVRLHVYKSFKLKTYKLFENNNDDLSWLFQRSQLIYLGFNVYSIKRMTLSVIYKLTVYIDSDGMSCDNC